MKAGGTLKTALGVLAIDRVDVVERSSITKAQANAAGYEALGELLEVLDTREGTIYRVELRYAGEDPRKALRRQSKLSKEELGAVLKRLDRLDRSSRTGPWTATTLRLIRDSPAVRAVELAEKVGRDKPSFKRDVRKLKNLGLTESLEVGYRLSPRGKAVTAGLGSRR